MVDEDPGGKTLAAAAAVNPVASNSVTPLRRMASRMQYVLGLKTRTSLQETLDEAIEEHESSSGTSIRDEEKQLLHKVIAFNALAVEDVMTPRADIVAVEEGVSLDDVKKVILDEVHTRLPVYRNTLDDITGFIHAKDLLKVLCNGEEFELKRMVRQALFVPPSMPVSTLMLKMQMSRVHMALVVDEFGGICGLVTLEDLVEEIVGDIEDEHDIPEVTFHKIGHNLFEASARMDIDELEKKLDVVLHSPEDSEEYDTLGGLIFYMLGRVPSRGEVIPHPNHLEFEIMEADLRRIKRVIIRKKVR